MHNNEKEFARLNFAIDVWNEGGPPKCRVVFANGCWDYLHIGHVKLLEFAEKLGDILVVGINSDNSVKQLKGPNRPVNTLEDRIAVLRAIKYVDFVFSFDTLRTTELILQLKPSYIVKASEYVGKFNEEERLAAESVGAEIKFFETVLGYSSTKTIEKLGLTS